MTLETEKGTKELHVVGTVFDDQDLGHAGVSIENRMSYLYNLGGPRAT
jgi:hypothetical protein